MNGLFRPFYLYLAAAVLLAGIGLYYFLFEVERFSIWAPLIVGSLFNFFLARQTYDQR